MDQEQNTPTEIIEKYCYSDNTSNCDTYGGLYQWDEMMQYITTEGTQGICPTGWHLPTDAEWCTLENYVDAGTVSCSETGWRGVDCGTNLKEGGSSGFEAFLAGYRSTFGSFNYLGSYTFFWSSSESGSNAWGRTLNVSFATVYRNNLYEVFGFSVRCLQDN